ncbi:hypothetical protein BJV78DRAFT_1354000 [Lactifluus subvellereus]|nr:hypothetical protein BJV78DRAFT_1354000 [Lactifluus subvellereus]
MDKLNFTTATTMVPFPVHEMAIMDDHEFANVNGLHLTGERILILLIITDNISVASFASFASSAFDTLTCHRELHEAQVDSDFDCILARLISEWYYTGASVSMAFIVPVRGLGLLSIPASLRHRVDISVKLLVWLPGLIILHSIDTSMFGFSPGNLFNVDSIAKRSLIISSVAAAIGLFIDVWLIFAYSGTDVRKFQNSQSLQPAQVMGGFFWTWLGAGPGTTLL